MDGCVVSVVRQEDWNTLLCCFLGARVELGATLALFCLPRLWIGSLGALEMPGPSEPPKPDPGCCLSSEAAVTDIFVR